jgi:F1F0 ATPase subunit 2
MTMVGVANLSEMAMTAAIWLIVGTLIGGIHFLTLRWTADAVAHGRSIAAVLAVQLVRLLLVGVAMVIIVQSFGALALVSAAAGILAARSIVLRAGAAS